MNKMLSPNKTSKLSSKIVWLILVSAIVLASILVFSWTKAGHGFGMPLLGSAALGTFAAILSVIAMTAPITSLLALGVLIFTAVRFQKNEKPNIVRGLFVFNFDILVYYLSFWILIISWFQSMDVIFPEGRNTQLLVLFASILAVSTISLGFKAFSAKHWLTQSSALFLFLLVFGALLLNIHTLKEPHFAPRVIAEYPSPNKKYIVTLFEQKDSLRTSQFYGFKTNEQNNSRRLGGWCDPRFIKWIDNETMLVSVDMFEQKAEIKVNQPYVQCP